MERILLILVAFFVLGWAFYSILLMDLLRRKSLAETLKDDYGRYFDKIPCGFDLLKSYFNTLTETRTLSYVITMRICGFLLDRGGVYRILLQFFRLRLRRLQLRFGVEISYKSSIGAGFKISHGNGIVIHPNAVIGKNCSVLQQVTIGNNPLKDRNLVAHIGDNCFLGAGAKIIGPVTIGNDVVVGAQSVVTRDVPDNSIAVGIPAKIKERK